MCQCNECGLIDCVTTVDFSGDEYPMTHTFYETCKQHYKEGVEK